MREIIPALAKKFAQLRNDSGAEARASVKRLPRVRGRSRMRKKTSCAQNFAQLRNDLRVHRSLRTREKARVQKFARERKNSVACADAEFEIFVGMV